MVGFPVCPGAAIVAGPVLRRPLDAGGFPSCWWAAPRGLLPGGMSLYPDGRGPTAAGEGRGLLFHSVRGLPVNNLLA